MIIEKVAADGYKNLSDIEILPDSGINILVGDNAQGKTNLIEALWLCTGVRSFRATRDKDIIGFDKERAHISLDFRDSERLQNIDISVTRKSVKDKEIRLNGVPLPLISKLFGSLCCVVFTPDDLQITKGPPDRRRSFTDMCASQLKRSFVWALNRYDDMLSQRNALIKDVNFGAAGKDQFGIWDEQIAACGAYITVVRNIYIRSLAKQATEIYSRLCKDEELGLSYYSSIYGDTESIGADYEGELKEYYYSRLCESLDDDLRAGYTVHGIHRDDLMIKINGLSVRDLGSQGQQRSAALVLKLAQARMIKDQLGEAPVMMLDDVLSELDPVRQRFVLENIEDMQVFITACDDRNIDTHGKIFHIRSGRIENN